MKRGITLVEILICISIIVIVTAIAYPAFSSAKYSAKVSASQQNLHQLYLALALYRADENENDFGSPCEMGLPCVANPLSLEYAVRNLPSSSKKSPCGDPTGSQTPTVWYIRYRPFDEASWLSSLKAVGNRIRTFYDIQCDFPGVDAKDLYEKHRAIAVSLDGSLVTKVATGAPDLPSFWGEQ